MFRLTELPVSAAAFWPGWSNRRSTSDWTRSKYWKLKSCRSACPFRILLSEWKRPRSEARSRTAHSSSTSTIAFQN